LLHAEQPDIALLDINTRGENVAAALQARGVPFVLVTGYAGPQGYEPVLRDALRIDKPVNYGELQCAIARTMTEGLAGCSRGAGVPQRDT
jgi:DNA-binding LytR/AlgR family response regulator